MHGLDHIVRCATCDEFYCATCHPRGCPTCHDSLAYDDFDADELGLDPEERFDA